MQIIPEFANKQSALDHFSKHSKGVQIIRNKLGGIKNTIAKPGGADMPEFKSFSDYQVAYRQFFGKTANGTNVMEFQRGNGDFLRYEINTGYFGVKTSSGTIRTFFRPDAGLEYYLQEIMK